MRLQKGIALLPKLQVNALWEEDPMDLFYFTGLVLSAGSLLLQQNGVILFVDGRYFEIAKKKSPCKVVLMKKEEVIQVDRIGFDTNTITVSGFETLKKKCKGTLVPLPSPLAQIRAIKDTEEMISLHKGANLAWRGFEHVCSILKEGITEKQVALEFQIFCLKNGAEKLSFETIIAFGENSAYPHHVSGSAKLKKGDIVLIDFGVIVDRYCSDCTRTIFFQGEGNVKLQKIMTLVKKAEKEALLLCRPGVKLGKLDERVREIFDQEKMLPYYVHNLGHGLGLQVHEYPRLRWNGDDKDVVLEEGMVFTVEPGIYLPGLGGVRYEDTIAITKDGYKNFYKT